MINGKKVLITGLTGNLGGSIAAALAPHNELWGYARYSKAGQQQFWQDKGVRTVVGDFGDGQFGALPTDFDYVIHCAANCGPESFAQGMHDNPQGTAPARSALFTTAKRGTMAAPTSVPGGSPCQRMNSQPWWRPALSTQLATPGSRGASTKVRVPSGLARAWVRL